MLQVVLKEEYKRLKQLVNKYTKNLNKLPKGSISSKKRNNSHYFYLAYRQGKKVKFIYVGKEDSEALEEIKEKVERRKEILNKLRQVKTELKELKKVIHE